MILNNASVIKLASGKLEKKWFGFFFSKPCPTKGRLNKNKPRNKQRTAGWLK